MAVPLIISQCEKAGRLGQLLRAEPVVQCVGSQSRRLEGVDALLLPRRYSPWEIGLDRRAFESLAFQRDLGVHATTDLYLRSGEPAEHANEDYLSHYFKIQVSGMDAWKGSCPLYDLMDVECLRDPRDAAYVASVAGGYLPSARLTEQAEGIGFYLRYLLVPAFLHRDFRFLLTKIKRDGANEENPDGAYK